MAEIRLGLIGDNIARSQSPRLHRLAGALCGLDVGYERFIPSDLGLDFDQVFGRCREGGYAGINITYPYKERVVPRLRVEDPAIAAIGACNTVLFGDRGPTGHNTDFSGFVRAFERNLGDAPRQKVAMAGSGGVGKAVAFALARLGCEHLAVFDPEPSRTMALARSVGQSGAAMEVHIAVSIDEAAEGSAGLVNCSPLGMAGHPGSAIPTAVMAGAAWAFDAVYTPVETRFLADAAEAGLEVMSGYELFFYQGVDAFELFTGRTVEEAALREALEAPDTDLARSA